jgi:hypothetical protein
MALGDGIRRNISTVTIEERNRLRDAIIALHTNFRYPGGRDDSPVGGVTFWFKQDEIHARTHVHGCPAFMPWHRELVNRFELLLRSVDPALSMHYWDWTEDPNFMFTSDFMGSPQGQAGAPWLQPGLYDPTAQAQGRPFRSDDEFDATNNPFDPPLNMLRTVQTGAPVTPDQDAQIIAAPDFPTFNTLINGAHSAAHFFIGGTLGNAHTSFRDPFVFLLHSNVDRLFAMWQRQPGHPERLDPAQVYGPLSNTLGSGDVSSGQPQWGILSPLEPWAGPEAQNAATGIIMHVAPARPWAPPENQQVVKDSRDPSVVNPPSYDTAPHSTYFIVDRDTFSSFEVQVSPQYPGALSLIYDSFTPNELGVPTGGQPAIALTFDSATGPAASGMTATVGAAQLEDPSRAPDLPQRITFSIDLSFTDSSAFGTFTEERAVNVRATFVGTTTDATLELVNQPNPYMLDGPVTWLSTDLRVFQIRPNETLPGTTIAQGDPDANAAAPGQFITSVVGAFNTAPNDANHPFLLISTDQQTSQLELSRTVGGVRVLNYAVAKVRYVANTVAAANVQVFFRMFSTMVSALDYDTNTNYRQVVVDNIGRPLLGLIGGEIASMPFYAAARIDTSTNDMSTQPDPLNRQTLNATGQEAVAYFGCWLDFNQTDPQFPLNPTTDGNFTNRLPIPQLIRGQHQCLVAEIFFQPGGIDPIPPGATPASSDRLSQRNLAIVDSDNPGNADSHTVQATFLIKPSPQLEEAPPVPVIARLASRAAAFAQAAVDLSGFPFDELMIRWNDLPRDATASLYVPEWNADDVLAIANLRQHPSSLSKIDDHTIGIRVADVSFVPIPRVPPGSYACLLSIVLPQSVVDGQSFTVDVRQFARSENRFEGAYRFSIPVRLGDAILPREVRRLAALRYVGSAIPAGNRWSPVFGRYLAQIEARLRGIGGDPEQVPASIDDPTTSLKNVCVYARGNLQIADRVKTKKSDGTFAPIANAGTTQTNIGADAQVGDLQSRAGVVLRDRAHVNGFLSTSQTVTRQNSTVVTGKITQNTFLLLPNIDATVTFPSSNQGAVDIEPGQSRTLKPGAYTDVAVKSRATLSLSTGTYFFDSLDIEPQAVVSCNSKAGQIVIYVRRGLIFRGAFTEQGGGSPRIFMEVFGTDMVSLEAPFTGTIAAPNALLNLATVGAPGHHGSFFGRDVTIQPDNTITWVPYTGIPVLSR